jgi:hypothetical protein
MKIPELIESLTLLQFTIEELQKDIAMQLAGVESTKRNLEKAIRQVERIGEWIAVPGAIAMREKETPI